jgi:hypothetical protein
LKPVVECCAPFLVFEFQVGKDFGVLHHGGVSIFPIDGASETFDVSVGKDVVGVAAALTEAVVIARSTIRKEAIVAPDIYQSSDLSFVCFGLDEMV